MKNNFLINHKRFKETILRKDLKKFLSEKKNYLTFHILVINITIILMIMLKRIIL